MFLKRTLMILGKQTFSWLNPNLEKFTPSTKPNHNIRFRKHPTPTYMEVLEKSLTPLGGGLKLSNGHLYKKAGLWYNIFSIISYISLIYKLQSRGSVKTILG